MSKTIEEIAKQYVWEKNLGNIGINTFLKESLFEPMYHIEIIAHRYAQSQTQELKEQNAELVEMLNEIYNDRLWGNDKDFDKLKDLITRATKLNQM